MGRFSALLSAFLFLGCPRPNGDCTSTRSTPEETLPNGKPKALVDQSQGVQKDIEPLPSSELVRRPIPPPPSASPAKERPRLPAYGWGVGFLLLAVTPSKHSAQEHEMGFRTLVGKFYGGKDWMPEVAVVKWWGDKWALVIAHANFSSTEPLCVWLKDMGWGGGTGLPGREVCSHYHDLLPMTGPPKEEDR